MKDTHELGEDEDVDDIGVLEFGVDAPGEDEVEMQSPLPLRRGDAVREVFHGLNPWSVGDGEPFDI